MLFDLNPSPIWYGYLDFIFFLSLTIPIQSRQRITQPSSLCSGVAPHVLPFRPSLFRSCARSNRFHHENDIVLNEHQFTSTLQCLVHLEPYQNVNLHCTRHCKVNMPIEDEPEVRKRQTQQGFDILFVLTKQISPNGRIHV